MQPTIQQIGEACERLLAHQEGAARLPAGPIYPAPYLDAPAALAALLTNPLLLAHYPRRMAATALAYASGAYDASKVRSVACWLLARRDRINSQTRVEAGDPEAERELLTLCDSPHLQEERAGLRRRVFLARPSEYGWVRGLLEAAILRRAACLELELLTA